MTEVQKVSIGGYAFTLEVEAYALVKQYLDELNEYYTPREGGAEVMEGFEERMAELLYEKCGDNGVASVEDVRRILDILGKPSAIESENDPDPKKPENAAGGRKESKKRLYRDPTGKMIAGVCSGLSAYFKLDVVLIRIIFIALFVAGLAIGDHSNGFIVHFGAFSVLVYAVLWIAMPEAKTVQQRWELGITNPPAGSAVSSSSQPIGAGLGRVMRIVIGCLLLLMAVSGLTFGVAVLFGHSLLGWDILKEGHEALSIHVPEALPMVSSFFYKLSLLLAGFLPMVGMLYGGIMLVFDFKSPSWRPGLVIFLLWIAALSALTVLTLMGMFHAGLLN